MIDIRFKANLSSQKEAAVKAVIEQLDGLATTPPLKQQHNWVNESKTRKSPKKL